MPNVSDAIKVEGLMDAASLRVAPSIQATAASTLTLSLASNGYQIFTGSTAGQIVKLGNATTYQTGHGYIIHNASTVAISVTDNANTVLFSLAAGSRATLILRDISTAAGVWTYSISDQGYWIFQNGTLAWTDTSGADLLIAQIGSGGSSYVRQLRGNGTPSAPTATLSGDRLGGFGFYGYNSGGANSNPSAEDTVVCSENHTPTAMGGDRIWSTVPNTTTTSTERMRLKNNGNLLLGTTEDVGDLLQMSRDSSVNFPMLEIYDDFLWTTLGSGTNPNSAVAVVSTGGTVTVETTATSNDYMGLINVATGTTNNNTGHAVLDFFNSVNKIRLGSKRVYYQARVMFPTLSTGGVTYSAQAGLEDTNAIGAPVNGLYFSYTHGTNSGQWVCTCRAASTSTATNSTVAVVAGQWYELRIEVDAAGTSVLFFIDSVLIGSAVTTNIPASTAGMRPTFQMDKGSTSNNSRIMSVDYLYLKMFR